jgi:hypothetical protein
LKKLHLVAFNNPFPPDYGGVMDIYFKIKAFHEAGVGVILHIFQYLRPPSPELLELCEEVHYYPRKTEWPSHLSLLPYIVKSRSSDELLKNLSKDEHPVLFEGLHTCLYLNHPSLKHKLKLARMHNIEYEYYSKLSKSALNLKTRLYFIIESIKLKHFEKILRYADHILAISLSDYSYFRTKYGNTHLTGPFHPNKRITSRTGKGKYILMHGNLSVEENEFAILHCIRNILNKVRFPIIIAGKGPTAALKREITKHQNIVLAENPSESEMDRLQHEAHIHLCYTFQSSGFKLKLLNSLFKGRFVVTNPLMTDGSGLKELSCNGNTDAEIISQLKRLISCEFGIKEIEERQNVLENYGNTENAARILSLID